MKIVVVDIDGVVLDSSTLGPVAKPIPVGFDFTYRLVAGTYDHIALMHQAPDEDDLLRWLADYGYPSVLRLLRSAGDVTKTAETLVGYAARQGGSLTLVVTANTALAAHMRSIGVAAMLFGQPVHDVFRTIDPATRSWDTKYAHHVVPLPDDGWGDVTEEDDES